MRILFFLSFVFYGLLLASQVDEVFINNDENISTQNLPKVIYLNYQQIPTRVINGEIFSVTIKALSTVKNFIDINYGLSNYNGLELLDSTAYRDEDTEEYYSTYYFLTKEKSAKIPDFTATLVNETETPYRQTVLKGEELEVITLNPKDDFSNIIADSFVLQQYKTTGFDDKHNIVIFVANAQRCNINAFKLNNVLKQGAESITESYFDSKITYYAIINKKIENFSFSYFNLQENKFIDINIPIIVHDDSVTTQSDLKPKDQSKERLKVIIIGAFTILCIIFIIWRKKYIYLIFMIFPIVYIVYISIPSQTICIKQSAKIHLLPVNNGTIFEETKTQIFLPKEGSVKNFTKVKLKNEKIGWVKNEDICKN